MIGPNAIIQLGETLGARHLQEKAIGIYAKAGCLPLLAKPPSSMVDERCVHLLFTATTEIMDKSEAASCLAEAGTRTGAYILENRIPRLARILLPLLPAGLALRILLRAIAQHSWTFAGSGRFSFEPGNPARVSIGGNTVATPLGCVWHVAVFNRLFGTLLRSKVEVRETCCCGKGHSACVFEISLK